MCKVMYCYVSRLSTKSIRNMTHCKMALKLLLQLYVVDSSRESARSGPTDNFLDDSSHVIEYLFTDVYYRGSGFGNKILKAMELHCHQLVSASSSFVW